MVYGGCSEDRHPLGLAAFAPLRFVPELLVVEEQLLPGCKHEIGTTIDAL
jgi:hypothetical protein